MGQEADLESIELKRPAVFSDRGEVARVDAESVGIKRVACEDSRHEIEFKLASALRFDAELARSRARGFGRRIVGMIGSGGHASGRSQEESRPWFEAPVRSRDEHPQFAQRDRSRPVENPSLARGVKKRQKLDEEFFKNNRFERTVAIRFSRRAMPSERSALSNLVSIRKCSRNPDTAKQQSYRPDAKTIGL